MMTRRLLEAVRSIGARQTLSGTSPLDQRRIVSMVDEGHSYGVIRRTLGVRNAAIDGALRSREDGDRTRHLLP